MRLLLSAVLCAAMLAALLAAGCLGTPGKPKVMVFLGKSSSSYNTVKPVVDAVEKEYRGKIIFENVDFDNPQNKGILKKYSVSMNPSVLIFNAQGQLREQYLGSFARDTLGAAVQSYIPTPGAKTSSASVPKNLQY
jgi:thiol-disulfide isomerase/thioredoxin